MIKNQFYIWSLAFIVLLSCTKDNSQISNEEVPGEIPGMGDAIGELQISEKFVLPEGITLVSIEGIDNPTITTTFDETVLKSVSSGNHFDRDCKGSGGEWMALNVTFKRDPLSNSRDFFLPAGCVFECNDIESQNGILIQDILLKFGELSEIIKAKIYLYCINKGRRGTSYTVNYNLKGITDCQLILEIIRALENKEIDITDFSDLNLDDYKEITNFLQGCIWDITNGPGLSDDKWERVRQIRNRR